MYKIDFEHPVSVYFVGIGGISMSGLAEILQDDGFTVSGSDRQESAVTRHLEAAGIRVYYGQRKENITPDIDVAVLTAAIHEDNPEFVAIRDLGIPHMTRAELLGQVMANYDMSAGVAGTHGKTTTTSMLSEILLAAKLDPTLSIGGILKSVNGNVRVGQSENFVAEACEYTNSFLSLYPRIGIILDIDADHLDFFKDINDIRHSFRVYAEHVPQNGTLIINADIPEVHEITDGLACRVVYYGSSASCDYYPDNISYNEQADASFNLHCKADGSVTRITLRVPGEHNVYNACAAFAAADLYGVDRAVTAAALAGFEGADRRFEYKGTVNGVTVIDDYAHHPTEIAATLHAAQKYPHDRLWVIFQPHTYTRTKALLPDFAKALSIADEVIVTDIYAARETDTLGMSGEVLRDEIRKLGHPARYIGPFTEIEKFVVENCHKNDLLITMGAGNVTEIAADLTRK